MKKSSFSTKDLILSAIKNKLEGENVSKLLLEFSLHTDNYNCHIKPLDSDKAIRFKLEKSETSMIKRMFVSKIKRKIENPDNYQTIIISVELDSDNFDIYLTDLNGEVTKLEI